MPPKSVSCRGRQIIAGKKIQPIMTQGDPQDTPSLFTPGLFTPGLSTPGLNTMADNILGQLYKNGQHMGALLRSDLQSLQMRSQLAALAGQAGFAEHAAEAKQRSPHFFFCRLHEI